MSVDAVVAGLVAVGLSAWVSYWVWRWAGDQHRSFHAALTKSDDTLREYQRAHSLPSALSHCRTFGPDAAPGREYLFRVVEVGKEYRFWGLCDAFPGLTAQSDDPVVALAGIVTVVYRKVTGQIDDPPLLGAMVAGVRRAEAVTIPTPPPFLPPVNSPKGPSVN